MEAIRNVKISDAQALRDIYNYYIEKSIITFEEDLLSTTDFENRIESQIDVYPWLVYEMDGNILGYAYASKFRERSAYRFSIESTIYLDHNMLGKGIGTKLYTEFFKILKNFNFKVAYGCIALPNSSSVRLHDNLGFRKVAHLSKVGFKVDRWIDVGYWEVQLT